jgi:FMN phosphatase YigB (HAD superfamily)
VFSGIVGVEKPDPTLFKIALEMAGNIAPEEALHIGDSMRKDYVPARSIGMHALLLDRFKTADAESWKQSGAPVLPDLEAAEAWLTKKPKEESEEEPLAAALLRRMSEKL